MNIFSRTNATVKRICDSFETKSSFYVFYFFNKLLSDFYEKYILTIIEFIIYGIEILIYPFLFIIFFPFSVVVELFLFTQSTKIKKRKTSDENVDLINKK